MESREGIYLLLDDEKTPLARGRKESPPDAVPIRILVMDDGADEVAEHEIIRLVGMGNSEPPLQCRVVRQRGDRVMLEKIKELEQENELRRNVRVPVEFESLIYPITGGWKGRRWIFSKDLSCGGVAFYSEAGLETGETMEVVIPVTESPVILRFQVLRQQEQEDGRVFYAGKFVDMCDDEDMIVREAVFNIQLSSCRRAGAAR